jgi:hypothetical protein
MARRPTSSARAGARDKHRGHTFSAVEAISPALPDVEVTTVVCMASNKSAEPNSVVVMMAFADHDALVEDDPTTYYLTDHYLNHRASS